MFVQHKSIFSISSVVNMPLHEVFTDFLKGENFHIDLSNKTLRQYAMDPDLEYMTEMKKAKQFIDTCEHATFAGEVYTIRTQQEITPVMLMLMVRYINIAHKAKRIIIVNDDVVFVPESLQDFVPVDIMKYINHRLNKLKYFDYSNKGREPKIEKIASETVPVVKTEPRLTGDLKIYGHVEEAV